MSPSSSAGGADSSSSSSYSFLFEVWQAPASPMMSATVLLPLETLRCCYSYSCCCCCCAAVAVVVEGGRSSSLPLLRVRLAGKVSAESPPTDSPPSFSSFWLTAVVGRSLRGNTFEFRGGGGRMRFKVRVRTGECFVCPKDTINSKRHV